MDADRTKKIVELAEKYRDYTAENLSRLVKIKSLSRREGAVIRELKCMMQDAGFDEVTVDPLGNCLGRIGSGGKCLVIDAHMDTVDCGNLDNWHFDPFSGTVKEGFVHGLGTVDQKGGAAAFVTAGRILKELGSHKDFTLYCSGTVMEEDCDGLCWKYIAEEDRIRPDAVVITEPTNLKIHRGHRGRMEIEISFRGISAHGSMPERGRNAIYMASRAALEMEQLNKRIKQDPFLGQGSVTVSQFISGSPSLCAVADFARIHLDRRLTGGETRESALAEIRSIIQEMGGEAEVLHYEEEAYTGLKYGMEKYFPTWQIPEDHPLIQTGIRAYQSLFNTSPGVSKWRFSTNGVTINGMYGIPVLGFGPGNEVMAHAADEKIPVDHLVKASAFYAQFAILAAGE